MWMGIYPMPIFDVMERVGRQFADEIRSSHGGEDIRLADG